MTEPEYVRARRQMAEIFSLMVEHNELLGLSIEDLQVFATMRAEQAKAIEQTTTAYQRLVEHLIDCGVHPHLAKNLVEGYMAHPDEEHDQAIVNAAEEAIRQQRDDHV